MPAYDFICESCGHKEVVNKSIAGRNDDPPMCQHGEAFHPATHAMKRVKVYNTSFLLKGGGWAADGYRSQKPS
jgi:predicted nucleic acid-binding Zn ribbon protein